MLTLSRISCAAVVAIILAAPMHLPGQDLQAIGREMGGVIGTVTDLNGDPVPNAAVLLKRADSNDGRTVVTPENGFFEFQDVKPGVPYEISVRAKGFADWTSPGITLEPGQFKIVTSVQLRVASVLTKVQVTYDPVEVATEQLKLKEQQRVFRNYPKLLCLL